MLGFAKLFNDELTLDNINRSRLVNMFILAITTHQTLNGSNRSHFVQSLEVGSEDFSGKVDEEDSEGRKALQIVCEYGKMFTNNKEENLTTTINRSCPCIWVFCSLLFGVATLKCVSSFKALQTATRVELCLHVVRIGL